MLNYDPNEHAQELLVLYALLKNAGVAKRESVALMSTLDIEDIWSVLYKIADLMDNNGWVFPNYTEMIDIIWPISEARAQINKENDEKSNIPRF